MSVAYYIVLDAEEPGFDTFVNGKAVAHATDELDELCRQNGLQTLDSFMGQSMDEISDMLGEDIELPESEVGDDGDGESRGDAKWFEPSEGLAVISAIISAIERKPDALDDPQAVLEDLMEYKAVLERAAAIEAQWALALDI